MKNNLKWYFKYYPIIQQSNKLQQNKKQMIQWQCQTKNFYIEKDETKKSQSYTLSIPQTAKFVDISPIIFKVPDWQQKHFQIYSPHQDCYINLHAICKENFKIPYQYVQLPYIMIKYYDEYVKSESENHSEQNKKQRSKQRKIKEVIELVHRWRQFYDSSTNQRKINLQESAKIVGISKKSLDDYFFQLRMGEKYGFDFTNNMDNKIGILRSFVKQKEYEFRDEKKQKVTKHSKKLKIIQQFAEKLNLTDSKQAQIDKQIELKSIKSDDLPVYSNNNILDSQYFWGSPFSPIQHQTIKDCEYNFLKDFDNLIEEPNDPFINFTTFKKKKSVFGEDSWPNINF